MTSRLTSTPLQMLQVRLQIIRMAAAAALRASHELSLSGLGVAVGSCIGGFFAFVFGFVLLACRILVAVFDYVVRHLDSL